MQAGPLLEDLLPAEVFFRPVQQLDDPPCRQISIAVEEFFSTKKGQDLDVRVRFYLLLQGIYD